MSVYMPTNFLVLLQMVAMWVDHMRSEVIVKPRYLWLATQVNGELPGVNGGGEIE